MLCIKNRTKREHGSVLLLTLFVITAMTALGLAFSEKTRQELHWTSRARDRCRAQAMACSGANLALALLHEDPDPDMDSLREGWARFGSAPFPDDLAEGLSFSGTIVDESGKLNINVLVTEAGKIDREREGQVRRLFHVLDLEEEGVASLLDWLDRDDVPRLHGAETDYYMNLSAPYQCTNGPFLTIGQLFLVKGVPSVQSFDEGKRLTDYFTVHSDGKVNINTAPKEVLECLSEKMDTAIAESIVAFRRDEDFRTVDDLKKVPGIDDALFKALKPWITVKSAAVTIESQGRCRGTVRKMRAVIQRGGRSNRVVVWSVQ